MLTRIAAGVLTGLALCAQAAAAGADARCPVPDAEHAPLFRSIPVCPHTAVLLCLQGEVLVEFTVNEQGRVEDPQILSSDHPGVFDQSVFRELEHWVYRPKCVDGRPTSAQQKTIIDFRLEEDDLAACQRRAELLHGESLELVSELVTFLVTSIDWFMANDQTESLDEALDGVEPVFTGDLGRIERFVHAQLREGMKMGMRQRELTGDGIDELFELAAASGNGPKRLDDETLSELHQRLRSPYVQSLSRPEHLEAEYARLLDSVSMSPDEVEAIVSPFVRIPGQGGSSSDLMLSRPLEVLDELFVLLRAPEIEWSADQSGFHFALGSEQARFHRLVGRYRAYRAMLEEEIGRSVLSLDEYRL